MNEKLDTKGKFGIIIIAFLGWMICFGGIAALIFLTEENKNYNGLAKTLLFIALSFFLLIALSILYSYIRDKMNKSEEIQTIRVNIKQIFKTNVVRKAISILIAVCILIFVVIEVFGTTDLDKSFNKSSYEAVYKASLSKNSNLKNIEQIELVAKVQRKHWFYIFSDQQIQLEYIYYQGHDIEFYDDPVYLEVGKFVPVDFYFDGNDYKWYIQMSTVKVSDW